MIVLSKGDNAVLATVFRRLRFQAPATANSTMEDGGESSYCDYNLVVGVQEGNARMRKWRVNAKEYEIH